MVPLPQVVVQVFARRLAGRESDPQAPAVLSPRGGMLRANNWRRDTKWNTAIKQAGVAPLTIHDCATPMHPWLLQGKRENVSVVEDFSDNRAAILRRYLELAPGARPFFPIDRRAPLRQARSERRHRRDEASGQPDPRRGEIDSPAGSGGVIFEKLDQVEPRAIGLDGETDYVEEFFDPGDCGDVDDAM